MANRTNNGFVLMGFVESGYFFNIKKMAVNIDANLKKGFWEYLLFQLLCSNFFLVLFKFCVSCDLVVF